MTCRRHARGAAASGRPLYRYRICLAVACVAAAGCSPREQTAPSAPPWSPDIVDGTRALQAVSDFVALGPRPAGSDAAARAAEHIAGKLNELGLQPRIDTFVADTPAGSNTFHNVRATIAGDPERWCILLSHIDTKTGIGESFVGANDSGSSTGLLLELARVLRQPGGPAPTVCLAFVDGEECRIAYGSRDGLHGSRRLASQFDGPEWRRRIRAVIVLDMIGDRDLTVTIPRNATPRLVETAFAAATADGTRSRFGLARGMILDDHVPFLDLGLPAIDLIDFEYGSAPGRNDYWHTEADTLDKLSADSLATVGRVVVRMLNAIAAAPGTPPGS